MTGSRLAVPPGRAGRLWLERRLGAARSGSDLLDRKLRILQAELEVLRAAAEDSEQRWRRCSAEADRTLLVASVLGGERSLRLATGAAAQVRITDAVTIGVRHPAAGSYTPAADQPWAGAAIEQAGRAHQAALAAAVNHAVAARALRIVEDEATTTRYRLRAIRDRLIPSLEQARAEVALAIDELERADGARLRRAAGARPRRQHPDS